MFLMNVNNVLRGIFLICLKLFFLKALKYIFLDQKIILNYDIVYILYMVEYN